MTPANLIMLALGLTAFAIGATLLVRRGGSDRARVARRMIGMMAATLGILLTIFAIGLRSPANA